MSESVFESFEAYLKGADYPKGKKKIMQAAVDLISCLCIICYLLSFKNYYIKKSNGLYDFIKSISL